jgi:HK97 family phage major capsid protein
MAEEQQTKSIENYLEDLEKGIKTIDTKYESFADNFRTIDERIAAVETKMNTPEGGLAPEVKDVENDWAKAYYKWFIQGKNFDQETYVNQIKDADPEKYKTLSSDNLTTGGYWMPPTRSAKIIEALLILDPFRAAAAVETLSVGDTLEMVREVEGTLAGWTSERGTRAATANMTLGMVSIPAHPMYAMPVLTQKMARMSSFDVEAWHQRKVAEYFAYLEGVAFIAGTGVGQPEGIDVRAKALVGATPTALLQGSDRSTNSGSATTIPDMDCLISMQDMLQDRYQANACWMMHRQTKSVLRRMTDGIGRYIVDENVNNSGLDTLFGKPILYMNSMTAPGTLPATYTVEDVPVIYGDMRQAYQIVDIPGMISIRDEITTKGQVALYVERMGVGGLVVDDLAFTCLRIHA